MPRVTTSPVSKSARNLAGMVSRPLLSRTWTNSPRNTVAIPPRESADVPFYRADDPPCPTSSHNRPQLYTTRRAFARGDALLRHGFKVSERTLRFVEHNLRQELHLAVGQPEPLPLAAQEPPAGTDRISDALSPLYWHHLGRGGMIVAGRDVPDDQRARGDKTDHEAPGPGHLGPTHRGPQR